MYLSSASVHTFFYNFNFQHFLFPLQPMFLILNLLHILQVRYFEFYKLPYLQFLQHCVRVSNTWPWCVWTANSSFVNTSCNLINRLALLIYTCVKTSQLKFLLELINCEPFHFESNMITQQNSTSVMFHVPVATSIKTRTNIVVKEAIFKPTKPWNVPELRHVFLKLWLWKRRISKL